MSAGGYKRPGQDTAPPGAAPGAHTALGLAFLSHDSAFSSGSTLNTPFLLL